MSLRHVNLPLFLQKLWCACIGVVPKQKLHFIAIFTACVVLDSNLRHLMQKEGMHNLNHISGPCAKAGPAQCFVKPRPVQTLILGSKKISTLPKALALVPRIMIEVWQIILAILLTIGGGFFIHNVYRNWSTHVKGPQTETPASGKASV